MKYLIMCEGPNELEIIRILLRHNYLKFTSDDLLGLVPYHARQIEKSPAVKMALNSYPGTVQVLRIGDSLNEKLKIPKDYKDKISSVEKYCTKPELEMLLIIAENLVKEFEKTKSKVKPKDFCKQHVKHGKIHYNNSTTFYSDYFGENPNLLIACLKEYQRIKKHKNDESYVAELLK